MVVPKSKETRIGLLATNTMEQFLLHHFDAGPSFHFGIAKQCSRDAPLQ